MKTETQKKAVKTVLAKVKKNPKALHPIAKKLFAKLDAEIAALKKEINIKLMKSKIDNLKNLRKK